MSKQKTEHVGQVSAIRFADPASQFLIATLSDGRTVKGTADADAFTPGDTFRFLGRWEEDPKYGPFFRFTTFVRHEPARREGVIRYLSKLCDDIGEGRASKLYDQYGGETCKVLRETPARAVTDGILTDTVARAASAELSKMAAFEQTKIDLHGLFHGRGFPGTLIDAAIEKWGVRAPEVIRRNPFRLLVSSLPGCGFVRCDRLWGDMKRPLGALKRQFLCGWNEVRNDRLGHTWVPEAKFADAISETVPGIISPVRALELGLRSGWLNERHDERGRWIAESSRAYSERQVARHAARLLAGGDAGSMWPAGPLPGIDDSRKPSDHQNAVWDTIRSSLLCILTGGPGTGKTFLTAAAMRRLVQLYGERQIGVCAPTGKAAVRLTQAMQAQGVPLVARTIHTTLQIAKGGYGGEQWEFAHNEANPLPFRFLIVDEVSMCDADLMAHLLAACATPAPIRGREEMRLESAMVDPPRCRRCHRELTDPESWKTGYGPHCRRFADPATFAPVSPIEYGEGESLPALPSIPVPGTHVLLIGDPHQLPPVGHGAPLRDLIAAGVPCGELTEIRRNAGTIVRSCAAIKAGKPIEFVDRYDPNPEDPKNLRVIETRDDDESVRILEGLLTSIKAFNPVWQTQVLTATNKKSKLSRTELNTRLQKLLNADGREAKGNKFRVDDKIICLRNSWNHVAVPSCRRRGNSNENSPDAEDYQILRGDDNQPEQHYVANGEIGRVLAVSNRATIARFSESEKLIRIAVGKSKPSDAEENSESQELFDLAYAVTCHKMQGSESPCVVVMADEAAGMVADRAWWYTAISRASKLCVIIGSLDVAEKQSRKVNLQRRKTFLAELIKEELS